MENITEEQQTPQEFLETLKEMLEYHNSIMSSTSDPEVIRNELMADNAVMLRIVNNFLYGKHERVIN
jgi:hypothetical protein